MACEGKSSYCNQILFTGASHPPFLTTLPAVANDFFQVGSDEFSGKASNSDSTYIHGCDYGCQVGPITGFGIVESIQWKQPRSVSLWEWRNECLSEIKRFFFICLKWTLIFCVASLAPTAIWIPNKVGELVWFIVTFPLLFSALIASQLWLTNFFGIRFQANQKELFFQNGSTAHRVQWSEIRTFGFADHPDVPAIRQLEVTIGRGNRSLDRKLAFDPNVTREDELSWVIQELTSLRPQSRQGAVSS